MKSKQLIGVITTNHNRKEIDVKSEYDKKYGMIRIDIKLKTSRRGQKEKK